MLQEIFDGVELGGVTKKKQPKKANDLTKKTNGKSTTTRWEIEKREKQKKPGQRGRKRGGERLSPNGGRGQDFFQNRGFQVGGGGGGWGGAWRTKTPNKGAE